MTALLVALGGAVGANLRYLLDRWAGRRLDSPFPWGTLLVNVTGSLILGLLAGTAMYGTRSDVLQATLGVGLCGALTTFSAFGYQTVALFAEGAGRHAITNVVVSVVAGVGAAVGGMLAAAAIWA